MTRRWRRRLGPGEYTEQALADVSPTRLRRFFEKNDGSYRVKKSLRDLCVFARQDVTRDPPFSQLDLVSCRNLLIYLDTSLQARVLPIFHYALQPAGYLLLGISETVGPFTDLFDVMDAKHKIYRARRWKKPRWLAFDFLAEAARRATRRRPARWGRHGAGRWRHQ